MDIIQVQLDFDMCNWYQSRAMSINYALLSEINVREYRRNNKKWTIQKNLQHSVTQDEEKQNKNTAQYVLDTIMRKQTQIPRRH
jgi:hypothetical protein